MADLATPDQSKGETGHYRPSCNALWRCRIAAPRVSRDRCRTHRGHPECTWAYTTPMNLGICDKLDGSLCAPSFLGWLSFRRFPAHIPLVNSFASALH